MRNSDVVLGFLFKRSLSGKKAFIKTLGSSYVDLFKVERGRKKKSKRNDDDDDLTETEEEDIDMTSSEEETIKKPKKKVHKESKKNNNSDILESFKKTAKDDKQFEYDL